MGHFNSTNITPMRSALTVQCEYCRSLSSGSNCKNCGAPLLDPFAPATPDNIRRFVYYSGARISVEEDYLRVLRDLGLA